MIFRPEQKERAFVSLVVGIENLFLLRPEDIEEIAQSLEHPELCLNSEVDRAALKAIAAIVREHGGKF